MSDATADGALVQSVVTDAPASHEHHVLVGKEATKETLEDYTLRFAPRHYRRWTPGVVAVSALGGIAYLADFAIGANIGMAYGTTNALWGIAVFAVVNVACLILRRDPAKGFFRSPGPTPAIAGALCIFLIVPQISDRDILEYQIALGLVGIGVVLWALTWLTNRGVRAKKTGFRDIEHMEDDAH